MKNIKKFYPLIVGLVLLISVAAYGTRAYFSDSTEKDVGINLELGHVEIFSDTGDWRYVPLSTLNQNELSITDEKGESIKIGTLGEENQLAEKVEVSNAQPGDTFKKNFTFENKSDLATKIKVVDPITKKNKDPFNIKINPTDSQMPEFSTNLNFKKDGTLNEVILKGKEKAVFDLVIEIDPKASEKFNISDDVVLDLMGEYIKIELLQADQK